MMQGNLRFGIIMTGLAIACGALGQGRRMITIDPAGEHERVYLSRVDAAAEDAFARMFEIPRYGEYRPYALMLINNSAKAIVALTIRWTATTGGKSIVYDSSSTSLLSIVPAGGMTPPPPAGQARVQIGSDHQSADGPVVLADGERMMVAPGLLACESMVKQHRTPSASSVPQAFQSAESISVTVDAAVLEDGQILGPDASRTVAGLVSRKAAVEGVARAVRSAELNGQDGAEALGQLANTSGTRDPEILLQSMIARMLLGTRPWRELLDKMDKLQLPVFYK